MLIVPETALDRSDVEQALDQPLVSCGQRNAAVAWPLPIHQRLERLVGRANSRGAKTNRKELSAAILLAFDHSPDELLQVVLRYRTATAADAMLDVPQGATVLPIARHKPGPRTA